MRPRGLRRLLFLVDVVEVFDYLAVVAGSRFVEDRADDGHALFGPTQLRGQLEHRRGATEFVTSADLRSLVDLGVADERLVTRPLDRSELDRVVHMRSDQTADEALQPGRGATLTRVLQDRD